MKAPIGGILAGLIATVVLSLLMLIKAATGMLPRLDVIAMLAAMAAAPKAVGWIMHFVIGALIYGIVFSAVHNKLPGGPATKGMSFSAIAWLLMMVAVMPIAGAGLFGLNIGVAAPVATLILHLIYGIVLGLTFDKLVSDRSPRSTDQATTPPGP